MNLVEARRLAEWLRSRFSHFSARVEIAGSIRREAPTPKDIELVVIPRWVEEERVVAVGQPQMFEGPPLEVVRRNLLAEAVERMEREGAVQVIKPGVPGIVPWELNPDGRYWRLIVSTDGKPLNKECKHEYR